MGRTKEWALEHQRIQEERAEAAYFAVPEALHQSLEIGRDLQVSHQALREENTALKAQIASLQDDFAQQASPWSRWKERLLGFGLGVAASVLASYIWLHMSKTSAFFR